MKTTSWGSLCANSKKSAQCERCGERVKLDDNGEPAEHETRRGLPCTARTRRLGGHPCGFCGLYVCVCDKRP